MTPCTRPKRRAAIEWFAGETCRPKEQRTLRNAKPGDATGAQLLRDAQAGVAVRIRVSLRAPAVASRAAASPCPAHRRAQVQTLKCGKCPVFLASVLLHDRCTGA